MTEPYTVWKSCDQLAAGSMWDLVLKPALMINLPQVGVCVDTPS